MASAGAVGAVVAGALLFGRGKGWQVRGDAYVNGKRTAIVLREVAPGRYLASDAAEAFARMAEAAKAEGVDFVVNSAFRTMAEQEKLYRERSDPAVKARLGPAARPGYSKHQSGVALDIESAAGSNAAFRWLSQNASRFGWKRTVLVEPWHWEYLP